MDMETWEKFYNKIMDDFGFDKGKDIESAMILNEIIEKEKNFLLSIAQNLQKKWNFSKQEEDFLEIY